MNSESGNGSPGSPLIVQTVTASSELAPLAAFLNQSRASAIQLSTTSKQLLDASLTVQQAGSELLELRNRFASAAVLPEAAQAQLVRLNAIQQKAISEGLSKELDALAQVGLADLGDASEHTERSPAGKTDFEHLIAQNQQYCEELIAAPVNRPRPASAVAADIRNSIRQIRASLTEISSSSPQF